MELKKFFFDVANSLGWKIQIRWRGEERRGGSGNGQLVTIFLSKKAGKFGEILQNKSEKREWTMNAPQSA